MTLALGVADHLIGGRTMDYHQVETLDKGITTKDGTLIRFEVHARSGEVIGLEIPTKNIGDFIAFLVGLSQFVGRRKEPSQVRSDLEAGEYQGALMDPLHVGVAQGRTQQEKILAFHMGAFSLGFSLDANALAPLRAAIDEILPTGPTPAH